MDDREFERHAIAHRLGFKTLEEMDVTLSPDDYKGWREYFVESRKQDGE